MNTDKFAIYWQNFAQVRLQLKFAFIMRPLRSKNQSSVHEVSYQYFLMPDCIFAINRNLSTLSTSHEKVSSKRTEAYQPVVELPNPFRGMEARTSSNRDPTIEPRSHGLDQRSTMEEVVSKMARRRSSDAGWSRRRWVKSCSWWPQALQEEFSFRIYPAYVREQEQTVPVAAKSGQFIAGERGQFLWGNRRIASMPNLCNARC